MYDDGSGDYSVRAVVTALEFAHLGILTICSGGQKEVPLWFYATCNLLAG